jgi:type II secretory pathway pseudopilin PulG
MLKARWGFTIIEITIAMAVAALIMGTLGGVFYYISTVTPQQSDQLSATNNLRLSLDWIQRDGVQAYSFTPNEESCPDPCEGSYYYGHFSSYIDMIGEATRTVAYRYECDEEQLVREEWTTEDPATTNTTIAFHIARCGDITFECGGDEPCEGWHPLTVSITATLNMDTDVEISETDSRHIEMRTARY